MSQPAENSRPAPVAERRRRVLYIGYHFPPLGGGGVQRNAKFVRYLPDFGYDSIVLTGPGGATDRWTPADETLHADVPARTRVVRVPGPEPEINNGWRGRLEKALLLQTPFTRWWTAKSVPAARELEQEIDIIFGSLVPYDCATAAAAIAQELGKPWVADLQDPWALDEMWVYPTSAHRRRDLARMRTVLNTASAIVMNTPEAARRVRVSFPELADRVWTVPNGFDPADLAVEPAPKGAGKFRIVHTGYFHTNTGQRLRATRRYRRIVGGAHPAVDIITRSPVYLLEALERMLAADPTLVDRLEVIFAGVLSDVDRELAARSPLVRTPGYVTHRESTALVNSADLLFLPMHDLPPGSPAGIVPGKTYEYMGSGRPILAAVPDGDARSFLSAVGTAFVCRPKDVTGMVDIITAQLRRKELGEPVPVHRPETLERFTRRNQTRDLVDVLNAVLRAAPAPSAAVGAGVSARRPATRRRG